MALTAAECRVVDRNGAAHTRLERDGLESLLGAGFFWLDLQRPSAEDLALLGDELGLHPLALEDSLHFGQRAKLEGYEDFVFLVAYGWAPDEDGLVEVHCYYSERFLVTVHHDDAPALETVRARCERTLARHSDGILVLHHVVDALVDSFFEPLERVSERLEVIEDEMIARPDDRLLAEIMTMRRRIALLRKTIAPQRDLFGRVASGAVELPGMTAEAERHFRDVYDHLFRLAEMIDAYRELMTGVADIYLSSASNRLGRVTKQLTLIATIFLPLTFVTGFFGQNFGWMVENVDSPWAFAALGLGLPLATAVVILVWFRRQGWF